MNKIHDKGRIEQVPEYRAPGRAKRNLLKHKIQHQYEKYWKKNIKNIRTIYNNDPDQDL